LNAKLYNGEDHPITKDAKKLADALKSEVKRTVNYSNEDSRKKKYEEQKTPSFNQKPIGKLTAPSYRHNNHSSMDFFKLNISQG